MTTLQLLNIIIAALLMQFAAGVGVVAWRRHRAPGVSAATATDVSPRQATGAWSGWRSFRVTRRQYEDASCSQCSFHLAPVDGVPLLPFLPGQFLTFSLLSQKRTSDSVTTASAITRCYSLSDRPVPSSYRVTIKRVPAPVGRPELPAGLASTYFHDEVREGAVLQVKAPAGSFFIDADASVPAVLVAGGIGMTPMMSMLRWCANEQPERTLYFFYGVRGSADHAFKRELAQMAADHPSFHFHVIYSQASADDQVDRDFQHAGRVDVDLLHRTLPSGRHQFYVCGPPAMMESLVPALVKSGVAQQDVHFEAFGPASVKLPGSPSSGASAAMTAPIEVKFSRSDRTLVWDGRDANLLDFTDRQGIAIESGCRTGSCGSCETRLVSGSVEYENPPDYDVAPGHCLLCVGRPTSAMVLEA